MKLDRAMNNGKKIPIPENEQARLATLRSYEILDTEPSRDFDDIAILAAQICETPIALISLVDENRQWFKSKIGIAERETPREIAFCAHGIMQSGVFVVEDALADERFASYPLVTGSTQIRFYAGAPLVADDGHHLGMLCVNDRVPRQLNEAQQAALQALSRQVVAQMELRRREAESIRAIAKLRNAEQSLKTTKDFLRAALDALTAHIAILDEEGRIIEVNRAWKRFADANGLPGNDYGIGSDYLAVCDSATGPFAEEALGARRGIAAVMAGEAPSFQLEYPCHSGEESRWFILRVSRFELSGPLRIVVAHENITARKNAELGQQASLEQLRKAEETALRRLSELRALFDVLPGLVWFKDLENRILLINKNAADAVGLPIEQIEGHASAEIYPDQAGQFYQDDLDVTQSGKPKIAYVEPISDATGGTRWLRTDKVPYFDSQGIAAGIVVLAQDITEAKSAEDVLKLHSGVFERMTEGVTVADESGRIIASNPAAERMFGYTPGTMIGLHVADLNAGTDEAIKQYLEQIYSAASRGENWEGEATKRRKDGTTFVTRALISSFESGGKLHSFSVQEDVTERKRNEAELLWKTAFLEAQVNSTIDGVLVVNDEGKKILQNQRFVDLLKIPRSFADDPDDAKQLRWVTEAVKDSQAFLDQVLYLYSHRDESSRVELEMKDGTFFDRDSSPVKDKDGKYFGRIWTFRDITERKRSEADLLWKTALLEAQVNSTIDGLLVVDDDGKKILQNQRFNDLLKIPRSIAEDADALAQFRCVIEAVKDSRTFIDRVLYLISHRDENSWDEIEMKDGAILDRYSSPVKDKDGRYYGRIFTYRDITERKRSEAELAAAHRELLEISRKAGMAEIAVNVLHNVGNVLNSVNISACMVEEIVKKLKTASLSASVGMIEENRECLADFLDNDARGRLLPDFLRRLADHFAGHQKTAIEELMSLRKNVEHIKEIVMMQQSYANISGIEEPVDLPGLIEDCLRLIADGLDRDGIEIVRDFQGPCELTIDKHKALQILINLLRNAKHACRDSERPDRRITIRIASDERWARISVIDNGVGIPKESKTRIFNHGFTTKKNGHGFGLHGSANAAQEMGGSLCAASDGPGQGAVFTLELPIPKGEGSR